MSRLADYIYNRWCARMGDAFDLIGRVAAVCVPSTWEWLLDKKWAPCFEGLHRLFCIDEKLAAEVLEVLRVEAMVAHDLQALQQCHRFARRIRGAEVFAW